MSIFEIAYWIGVFVEMAIRAPLRKTWKGSIKIDQRVSRTEKALLGLLAVVMILLPLIYSATNWLAFADYNLPRWMGWVGIFILICALLIFIRSHIDLKSNWSPTLEIYDQHTLVTKGIYKYIRHPMYASQWLWVIAQILLLQNWIAGPIDIIFFIPFYILRVKAEERMLVDTFGKQYQEYMKRTGGVIPRKLISR